LKGGNVPMNVQQSKKGFTIIEVVLVLAIAGLIFLMVFIALPALQSGQRDTARKNDASVIISGINTYAGANRGDFPTIKQLTGSDDGTIKAGNGGYVDNVSSNTVGVTISGNTGSSEDKNLTASDDKILIREKARCGAASKDGVKVTKGSARQYAVILKLEAAGGTYFCQDS